MKKAKGLPARHRRLGAARLLQGALGVDEDVGAQPRVGALDALEHGPTDLHGGQGAAANHRGQLHGGGEAEIVGSHGRRRVAPRASASCRAVNG